MAWDELCMTVNFLILNQKYFQVLDKGKATFTPVRGFLRIGCERNSDFREKFKVRIQLERYRDTNGVERINDVERT
jgi:hypothetical protein